MIPFETVAKTAPKLEDIVDKKSRGATKLELHLEDDCMEEYKFEEYVNMVHDQDMEIVIVHTPMDCDYELQSISNPSNFPKIRAVAKLAQMCAERQDNKVKIIIHNSASYDTLIQSRLMSAIEFSIYSLYRQFDRIQFVVEISTMLNVKNNKIQANANNVGNLIKIIDHLNGQLGEKSVGLVLDTCHAIANNRIMEDLGLLGKYDNSNRYTLEGQFKSMQNNLEIVHLANSVGYGLSPETHAQPFKTEEDIKLLNELIEYTKRYHPRGLVTLEVNEDNYTKSINFSEMSRQIEKICNVK